MNLSAVFATADKARLAAEQLDDGTWWAENVRVSAEKRVTVLSWTADVKRHNRTRGAQQDYFDLATRLCGYYGSTHRFKVKLTCTLDDREGEKPLVWERECPYVP